MKELITSTSESRSRIIVTSSKFHIIHVQCKGMYLVFTVRSTHHIAIDLEMGILLLVSAVKRNDWPM